LKKKKAIDSIIDHYVSASPEVRSCWENRLQNENATSTSFYSVHEHRRSQRERLIVGDWRKYDFGDKEEETKRTLIVRTWKLLSRHNS